MKTTFNISNRLTMVSEIVNDSIFQVLEFDSLLGVQEGRTLMGIKYINDLKLKLKQVRIVLDEGAVRLKSGTLSYMRGDIEAVNKQKLQIPLGSKLFQNRIPKELNNKTLFKGSGEIFLEPSFGYFVLIELEDEEIIVSDNIFLACEETVEVIPRIKKTDSINDEDILLELKLKGEGIVVLELPVPEGEIIRCKLYKDKLIVNGDFVVLTTNTIEHNIENLNVISNTRNKIDESKINIYSGIGEVWLLPTQNSYNELQNISDNQKILYTNEDD